MEPAAKAERSLKRLLSAAEEFSRDLHAIKPRRALPAKARVHGAAKASELPPERPR